MLYTVNSMYNIEFTGYILPHVTEVYHVHKVHRVRSNNRIAQRLNCIYRRRQDCGFGLSLRGDSRSYILAPIDSSCVTLYRQIIVTFALLSTVSGILQYPTAIPDTILWCSLWSRSVMLWSADSEDPRQQLISCEIIFEVFQRM